MENKIKEIADHYKIEKQQRQLAEECAELIQATSKYMRYREQSYASSNDWTYIQNVIEEIADVEIMLEEMKYLLNINKDAIEQIKANKIERQLKRIQEEKK